MTVTFPCLLTSASSRSWPSMSFSKRRYASFLGPVSESLGIEIEWRERLAPRWCLGSSPAMLSGLLQVDLAVVEVGIGGAYDCTNIIR